MLFEAVMDHLRKLGSDFDEFTGNLKRLGLEYFRRYYGPYRAIVEDNADPAGLGRVTVSCPRARMLKDNGHWLFPMAAGAGPGHGEFFPPEKGDAVWIFFDNGDPNEPACYLGGWYHGSDIDSELAPSPKNAPKKRGWVTPGGNKIIIDDTNGSESILVKQKSGKIVRITKDKISVGSKDGSFEPMLLGKQVKNWLDNHTHPHAYGPTQKPLTPLPQNALSSDTETS
jgi:hypothetical protein